MTSPWTIHLIDDDAAFRDSLRLLLESQGYLVVEYPDGHVFAGQCAEAAAGCALVDVRMPGLDGLALQELLNRRGIAMPLILMTGDADVPMAVRAMRAGAADFIEKPFELAELRAALDRALRHPPATAAAEDPAVTAFRGKLAELTAREREILEAVVAGHPTKVIAHLLDISPRTVHAHRLRLGDKLGVSGLSNLVRLALASGVKPLPAESDERTGS